MVLVTVIGGLTTALKYKQKTNVRLAKERRLLQGQVQAKEDGEQEAEVSSNVSLHQPNLPNFPNMIPQLQYQAPYVQPISSLALDTSNQAHQGFYPHLQPYGVPRRERQQWSDRAQRLQLDYNPHFTGHKDMSVNILPPSAPPHQIQLQQMQQERQVQAPKDEVQLDSEREDSSENMAEVKKWKSEVEVLKRQNQSLVNKYRLLQGSTEADI